MNQLKKLLGLSLISSLTACLVVLIFFANKPLNAQTPSSTNSLSSNSSSDSEKSWLEINISLLGGIASTVASIISISRVSHIQEQRIKLLKEKYESREEEYERQIKEMEVEFQRKYNRGEDQKKMNTDFYALVYEELGDDNMSGSVTLSKDDESRTQFLSRISESLNEFEYSRKAINALLFSRIDKEGEEKKLLKSIIFEVIDNNFPNISDSDFDKKCIHLYSYLRGWLVCSIKYKNTQLPVEWIKNNAFTKQEKLKILDDTRIFILNNQKLSQYIEEESRKLISEYINILIEKI